MTDYTQYAINAVTEQDWIVNLQKYFCAILDIHDSKENKNYFSMCTSYYDVVEEIKNFIIEWETKIEGSKKEAYVTDRIENTYKDLIAYFVTSVVEINTNIHEDLLNVFLHSRHIGYGFFYSYANFDMTINDATEILERYNRVQNSKIGKKLYLNLVEYYDNFYGKFSDNEEAIRFICIYNNSEVYKFTEDDYSLIANACYKHGSIAGDPGDLGYAFNGLNLIREHIHRLDEKIIRLILNKYTIYDIVYREISRRQIITIIKYSNLNNQDRYKFFYLDSMLYANVLNTILYNEYRAREENISINYLSNETCNLPKLNIFTIKKITIIDGYWINDIANFKRSFFVGDNKIVEISVSDFELNILFSNRNFYTSVNFEYNAVDHYLEKINSKDTVDKLTMAFLNEKQDLEGNFLFSHIYLDGYRGLNKHQFSFDGKYLYDVVLKRFEMNKIEPSVFPNFYGENIHSLSCFVGKNGTGKTSVMDFLRDHFFDLLLSQRVEKQFKYAVIFTINDKKYCLSNIEQINREDLWNLDIEFVDYNWIYKYQSFQLGKTVYFSSMVSQNDRYIFPDEGHKNILNEHDKAKNEVWPATSSGAVRNIDFSESKYFMIKLSNYGGDTIYVSNRFDKKIIKDLEPNYQFIYQIVFLVDHLSTLSHYFEEGFSLENLSIHQKGVKSNFVNLKSFIDAYIYGSDRELIVRTLCNPYSEIRYLSSGQSAKLSFLSKLYWYLQGHRNHQSSIEQDIESLRIEFAFNPDDSLSNNQSVLIFIDEGELYYHPEWQRRYISSIVDMINQSTFSRNIMIQLMITTNSPFMLSDVRKKDIFYLPHIDESCNNETFGQNIHTLLTNNFYMENTIGEIAIRRISKLIEWIQKFEETNLKVSKFYKEKKFSKDDNNQLREELLNKENHLRDKLLKEVSEDFSNEYSIMLESNEVVLKIKDAIELIGEDLYRHKLMNMYYEHVNNYKDDEIQRVKNQIKELEIRLEQLNSSNKRSSQE